MNQIAKSKKSTLASRRFKRGMDGLVVNLALAGTGLAAAGIAGNALKNATAAGSAQIASDTALQSGGQTRLSNPPHGAFTVTVR